MTIYNLGNIKGEKGDKGDSVTGPTGPVGVGIKSIEQITYMKFKFCLTDGSEYIINYGDEPTFDGISVSSTQDVLSYADGDSTVLSAQLTNQGQAVSVSGESVTFEVRKVSDDSLVETLTDTTDGTGLASVEYFGKGVGDLSIKCQCRSVIETYSNLEDCWINNNSQYSTTTVLSIPIPTDSDLIAEFDLYKPAIGNCWLEIGADIDNNVFGGLTSGSGKHGVYVKQNGSYVSSDDSTTQIFPNNTSKEVILKLENNTVSSTANNDNRSTINNVISARNYQRIYCKDGAYITNLKIKKL